MNNKAEDPNLWNNATEAQKLMRERTSLETQIEGIGKLERELDDALTLIELGEMEGDDATVTEGEQAIKAVQDEAARLQVETLAKNAAEFGIDLAPRLTIENVSPPPDRVAGQTIGSVSELAAIIAADVNAMEAI